MTADSEIRRLDRLELRSIPREYPTAACNDCGDEYSSIDLPHGICDACDNEARGLCACGAYPGPNRRQCKTCAAEDYGDVLFHADR